MSKIFEVELPPAADVGHETLKTKIFEVMRERRGAGWDREPVMPLMPSSKYFPKIRVQIPA
ncbi:MAG TPA: hypothetical protein ENF26_02230 [Methanomicrobia archaeon]|nr:hypothetical protein [Methanomicrobia archaeon]HEX58949.1 hypothetical protein [Methanomicrobia archaeon]